MRKIVLGAVEYPKPHGYAKGVTKTRLPSGWRNRLESAVRLSGNGVSWSFASHSCAHLSLERRANNKLGAKLPDLRPRLQLQVERHACTPPMASPVATLDVKEHEGAYTCCPRSVLLLVKTEFPNTSEHVPLRRCHRYLRVKGLTVVQRCGICRVTFPLLVFSHACVESHPFCRSQVSALLQCPVPESDRTVCRRVIPSKATKPRVPVRHRAYVIILLSATFVPLSCASRAEFATTSTPCNKSSFPLRHHCALGNHASHATCWDQHKLKALPTTLCKIPCIRSSPLALFYVLCFTR